MEEIIINEDLITEMSNGKTFIDKNGFKVSVYKEDYGDNNWYWGVCHTLTDEAIKRGHTNGIFSPFGKRLTKSIKQRMVDYIKEKNEK